MKKEMPKFHETFIPVLDTLSSGETIAVGELKKRVRDANY